MDLYIVAVKWKALYVNDTFRIYESKIITFYLLNSLDLCLNSFALRKDIFTWKLTWH